MKKVLADLVVLLLLLGIFASCGPRPQYKTSQGKKKLKYYNSIQYDRANKK